MVDVDALKDKAIEEFEKLIRELKKGKKPNYEYLLNLISFIGLPTKLDNHEFIKQWFLNYYDTTYIHLRK